MSIHRIARIGAAAGAAALTSCAPAIRSQRDEAIPVPQGATWAWATPDTAGRGAPDSAGARRPGGPARRPRDVAGATAIPRQRLHRALEASLVAKGFHKVDEPSDADFLLTLALDAPGRPGPGPGRTVTAVSVGWYGGFGGWGPRGRFGRFQPWGGFGPWAGWAWQPWGFGWYGVPYWGTAAAYPVAPRDMTVVALLRVRSSGDVAWRAQYRADAYDLAYLSQQHAQEIADKLVASLR
jgi:hypothetical protein